MTSRLFVDGEAITTSWQDELDITAMTDGCVRSSGLLDATLDVVAIGKSSLEMSRAVDALIGERVARRMIVVDRAASSRGLTSEDLVIAEHPVPGANSAAAGQHVQDFLAAANGAEATLFLISGGASSLCVLPQGPVTLADLQSIWNAALASGVDITTLNKIRAATSALAGGAVLRAVRSKRSVSFVLVDNVISGARWVASGFTYDYFPSREELEELLGRVGLFGSALGQRVIEASTIRASVSLDLRTQHENVVLGEPSMMLERAIVEARRRGYRVVDMGDRVQGDVSGVVEEWSGELRRAAMGGERTALIGVGEVTVKVDGSGAGGRCQEFAWLMASPLAALARESIVLARASDGRDYLEGVGGAWVDETSLQRAATLGHEWRDVAERHDTNVALGALGQLLPGGHSGWNLCDLYVAIV